MNTETAIDKAYCKLVVDYALDEFQANQIIAWAKAIDHATYFHDPIDWLQPISETHPKRDRFWMLLGAGMARNRQLPGVLRLDNAVRIEPFKGGAH